MTTATFIGLSLITAGATLLGSLPILFHKYLKESQWNWWESFGGGVMISASFFSLFLPAHALLVEEGKSNWPMIQGMLCGSGFIVIAHKLLGMMTTSRHHRKAFLFVLAMGVHNIPEGLAVGVDVAALGWEKALPLGIAISIQNFPEGLVSSLTFLISGFSVGKSLGANAVTAVIEAVSSYIGFSFTSKTGIGLPFLLSFSGACMTSVVLTEGWEKWRRGEGDSFSLSGFLVGLSVCAVLDLVL